MRPKLTREFFIPRSYTAKVRGKDVPAEVYLIDSLGGLTAMGFGGKRAKPDFHIRFQTEQRRAEYVADYLKKMKEREDSKKADKAKAGSFEHTLKVGDILYTSWGYDQTNIDFYQVTKLVGKKSVMLQEINGAVDHHDGCSSNMVVAGQSAKAGTKPMLKRVHEGNTITIESYYGRARPWNGEQLRETDWYSGH